MAFEEVHLVIQVFGSYGYSAEYGIERYFRNARAPIIYEGTTQIHKMMQAEHALGFRRLNGHTGEMAPLVSWRAPGAAAPPHAERGAASPPGPRAPRGRAPRAPRAHPPRPGPPPRRRGGGRPGRPPP